MILLPFTHQACKHEAKHALPACSLQLPAICNRDGLRALPALRAYGFDLLHNIHTLDDRPENDMLAVEPASLHCAEEELRAVRVGTGVCHRQDARAGVLQGEVL